MIPHIPNTPACLNQLACVKCEAMNKVISLTLYPATQLNAIRPTSTNPEPDLAIPPEQIPFNQNSIFTRFTHTAIMPHAHCQPVPSQPMFQQWCNKHTNMTQKIHHIANRKKVDIIIHLLSRKTTTMHANDSANTTTISIPAKFGWTVLHEPTQSTTPNSTTEGAHSPALYDKNIPMTYQLETTSTIRCHHICFCRMPDNIKCTMLPWVGSLTQSHTQTRPPVQPLTWPKHASLDYIYMTDASWTTTMYATFSNWHHKDLLRVPAGTILNFQ